MGRWTSNRRKYFLPHQFRIIQIQKRILKLQVSGGAGFTRSETGCIYRVSEHTYNGYGQLSPPGKKFTQWSLSPFTNGYKSGKHRIQGISDEFIPPIVELKKLDHIVSVHDGDAIYLLKSFCRTCWNIFGANFIAALMIPEWTKDLMPLL